MPTQKPQNNSNYLSHGAGSRNPSTGASSRQDGARMPKQRPQQPPKR